MMCGRCNKKGEITLTSVCCVVAVSFAVAVAVAVAVAGGRKQAILG